MGLQLSFPFPHAAPCGGGGGGGGGGFLTAVGKPQHAACSFWEIFFFIYLIIYSLVLFFN
jgi:hypothetical protein